MFNCKINLFVKIFLSILIINNVQKIEAKEVDNGNVEKLIFQANDFKIILYKENLPIKTIKTAGVIINQDGSLRIFEQSDGEKILNEYNFFLKDSEVFTSSGGGVKRIFSFKNNLIGLFTLKNKNNNCFYASLINLTNKNEFFRGHCLPEIGDIDFNGIGGGNAELNDKLLIAIGTPASDAKEISALAQNLKSPYGKILFFSVDDIKKNVKNISQVIPIYSMGHRNPQGLLNVENKIYSVEHGPRGGDEINSIEYKKNYGWPLFSLGSKYSGAAYQASAPNKLFKEPMFAFIPSIATSNITSCPKVLSERYKPLTCLLISSLRGQSISMILIEKHKNYVIATEHINIGMRVREFYKNKEDIYITTDGHGLYKLEFDKVQKIIN